MLGGLRVKMAAPGPSASSRPETLSPCPDCATQAISLEGGLCPFIVFHLRPWEMVHICGGGCAPPKHTLSHRSASSYQNQPLLPVCVPASPLCKCQDHVEQASSFVLTVSNRGDSEKLCHCTKAHSRRSENGGHFI